MKYYIVSEETIDEIVADIGYGRDYFLREAELLATFNSSLVVYNKDGVWKSVTIDNAYDIDFVMTQKEDKL